MRFNEFNPLIERQRPQLPQNRRITRAVKTAPPPVTTEPTTAPPPVTTEPTTAAPTTAAPTQQPSLLNRMGNKLASTFTTQGRVDSQAQKIFIEKFHKTLDYNIQSAQQQGMKFNLKGFVDGYIAKNHWKPGQLQSQLDQAVATNNRKNIAATMAQIGKANTSMYSPTREPEIAGAFGDAPTQAAPTQSEPTQAPPDQPAPPLIFGGKTIDPSTPLYAKVLSMMKQQGVA